MGILGLILVGVAFTSVVVLVVLAFVLEHRYHLRKISGQLDHTPVNNEELLKDVVRNENAATRASGKQDSSATRDHVSNAVDSIHHDTETTKLRMTEFIKHQTIAGNEFRGQLTQQKSRIQWVIGVTDTLTTKIKYLALKIKTLIGPVGPPDPPDPPASGPATGEEGPRGTAGSAPSTSLIPPRKPPGDPSSGSEGGGGVS